MLKLESLVNQKASVSTKQTSSTPNLYTQGIKHLSSKSLSGHVFQPFSLCKAKLVPRFCVGASPGYCKC